MSARSTPRLHRLPVRTDYVLVPAPLDLSLPQMTEKSTLPAIIVTPSSPSSARDFSIAFLQPPPKQSLRDRMTTAYYYNSNLSFSLNNLNPFNTSPTSFRLRSIIIVILLVFVLLCHLVTHQLASAYRPRMDMEQTGGEGGVMGLKNVQKSFSWSRIMGSSLGVVDGDGDVNAAVAAVVSSAVVPAGSGGEAAAPHEVDGDILGMALDGNELGRVEAL